MHHSSLEESLGTLAEQRGSEPSSRGWKSAQRHWQGQRDLHHARRSAVCSRAWWWGAESQCKGLDKGQGTPWSRCIMFAYNALQ